MHAQRPPCADGTCNAVHGSDSPTSAQREIKFFFPHRTAARAPAAPGGKVKLQSSLEGALCKGLAILARDKPAEDTMTALAWLGDWLLENTPLKPKIVASNDLHLIEDDDGSDFAPSGGAQEMAHGSTDAAERQSCVTNVTCLSAISSISWVGSADV